MTPSARPVPFVRTPLNARGVRIPKGRVYTLPERCKGCRSCIEFCPREALMESSSMNSKGYHYPVVQPGREEDWVHCGFCTVICPEFAIYTVEVSA
ncbi:MAG: ferredoxin family protein [Armatimonadetes bacterium]|nr:ferredoxin family protein [Armatimonadota bacterium]MDW8152701.1 ferredoxin family protein [Armatimonadota bacterium]